MIPEETVGLNPKMLVSGIPEKMSKRVRAPIYNQDLLDEDPELNKRITFGLNDIYKPTFFHCYR